MRSFQTLLVDLFYPSERLLERAKKNAIKRIFGSQMSKSAMELLTQGEVKPLFPEVSESLEKVMQAIAEETKNQVSSDGPSSKNGDPDTQTAGDGVGESTPNGGQAADSSTGGSTGGAPPASTNGSAFVKARKRLQLWMWIGGLIAWVIICVIAISLSHLWLGSAHYGIYFFVIYTAFYFGTITLFYGNARFLTALFGGFTGTGVSEALQGGQGLIEKLNLLVGSAVTQLKAMSPVQIDDGHITAWVWVFLIIYWLCLIPALFAD